MSVAVKTRVPDEVCGACGKTLPRRVLAHVFDDQVVCTACVRRLRAERAAAERVPAPATERQIAYARELGLAVPPDATCEGLSALITQHLDRPGPPELQAAAAALGIPRPESVPGRVLTRQIDERGMVRRWVYSVCRHLTGADWLLFADSRLPDAAVLRVVDELMAPAGVPEQLWDQDEGLPTHAFENACDARGILGGDDWYFFGRDGASSRTKLYAQTVALIDKHVGMYLPRRL